METAPVEQVDGFRDDGKQGAAETLVEGTLESEFAAERFSADDVFDILSHAGQRYVLTYLLQSTGPVSLSTLTDYAASQSDSTVDSYFRKHIVIELTHTVLPKLADNGFIEYDREQQLVEPTELTPAVEPYLRVALCQQDHAADLESDRD
jgi:uncharacterized protein YqfB (UPF0267 family)